MAATRSCGFLRYFKLECLHTMSVFSGYSVADVSHVPIFSNFDGFCVSDNLRLGPCAGYVSLNHHDVDANSGVDIGYLVKLNMEAMLAERRGQLPEEMVFQLLEGTMSTAHFYCH